MAYSNASVAQMSRDMTSALVALQREITALRAEVARLSAPAGAPVAVAAASPVVVQPIDAPVAAKVALHCAGHGKADANKACQRDFGKVENLAAHNAWAHKA